MFEIAICDDDPSITVAIADTLKRNAGLLPEPFHIQLFAKGTDLIAALPFDIIFLDIELGDTTGIWAAGEIRKRYEETALVFVSAHETYCKELFRFDTIAFLGKPINELQLQELLPRIAKKLTARTKMFTYRVKDTLCRVPVPDILFFESKARQIEIVTQQKREFFYGKLDEVETVFKEQLKHLGFVRIHHSFLANLDNVERFENNTVIMTGNYILPVAQRKQKEIRQLIMDYYNTDEDE
jgi:DNA-binding LytR/AlgR family response regulator